MINNFQGFPNLDKRVDMFIILTLKLPQDSRGLGGHFEWRHLVNQGKSESPTMKTNPRKHV